MNGARTKFTGRMPLNSKIQNILAYKYLLLWIGNISKQQEIVYNNEKYFKNKLFPIYPSLNIDGKRNLVIPSKTCLVKILINLGLKRHTLA
jgi:hypothetical protein